MGFSVPNLNTKYKGCFHVPPLAPIKLWVSGAALWWRKEKAWAGEKKWSRTISFSLYRSSEVKVRVIVSYRLWPPLNVRQSAWPRAAPSDWLSYCSSLRWEALATDPSSLSWLLQRLSGLASVSPPRPFWWFLLCCCLVVLNSLFLVTVRLHIFLYIYWPFRFTVLRSAYIFLLGYF